MPDAGSPDEIIVPLVIKEIKFMLALSRMSDGRLLDEVIVFTVSIFMLLYPGRQMPVRQQFFSFAILKRFLVEK